MHKNYDVVMYFYWAPVQVVHKYLALHNRLQKHCSVLTIIAKNEFGLREDEYNKFKEEDKRNVVLASVDEALDTMREVDFKVGVFSSNGRKGWVAEDGFEPPAIGARWPGIGKDIQIAKDKGAVSIQISEMITDIYYAGADIMSLTGPKVRSFHLAPQPHGTYHRYQWRPFDANPEPKYIFSNCLLWDNTEECVPYTMSREQFCEKYNLDKDKEIFVYLPSNIQHVTAGSAREVYKTICSMENVIVKVHPNEHRRLAAYRFENQWSYEVCGIKNVPVLDPIDTHWCYKYADCGISNQSSVCLEFPAYDTPFLYVHPEGFAWAGLFYKFAHICSLGEVKDFLNQKKYLQPIAGIEELCADILADPKRTSAELLTEQILELI